jgi:hypothetical protein
MKTKKTIENNKTPDDVWSDKLCLWLTKEQGYLAARTLPDGSVAGLISLMFTRAICLGCNENGYGNRFCFDDFELASQEYNRLLTEDDEPRGYIARR